MKKKFIVYTLLASLALNNSLVMNNVYAVESNGTEVVTDDVKETRIVYVKDGEGDANVGEGTKDSPYTNIRTALNNIKDGEVLRIIGQVSYTKYEVNQEDKSALPLYINKNITIEGEGIGSSLYLRTTIQLGANVTFKNLRLELVPQISMFSGNSGIIGQAVERDTSIFAAGYELTLDNVNTQVGNNFGQYSHRPYISGGRYKGKGSLGNKSVINVINPNKETKISAIYAGDYWEELNIPVELNLDCKLIDTTIHTGGVKKSFNNNVTVNLKGKTNVVKFDRTNHSGNLNLTLDNNYYTTSLNINNIDNLKLNNNAKIILPKESGFDIQNLILGDKSLIDFRDIEVNPIIKGDFNGTNYTKENIENCSSIFLNETQTLEVNGSVSGLTRLNVDENNKNIQFKDKHDYIKSNLNSLGDFSIEGTDFYTYELNKSTNSGNTIWTSYNTVEDTFKQFNFLGGEDKIIKPTNQSSYFYPIEFINKQNISYKPDFFDELLQFFEIKVTRADGTPLDNDNDIFVYWNEDKSYEDVSIPNEIEIQFLNLEKCYGDLILTVTHIESGESISKNIKVLKEDSNTPNIPEDIVKPIIPTEPSKPVKPIEPIEPEKPTESLKPIKPDSGQGNSEINTEKPQINQNTNNETANKVPVTSDKTLNYIVLLMGSIGMLLTSVLNKVKKNR